MRACILFLLRPAARPPPRAFPRWRDGTVALLLFRWRLLAVQGCVSAPESAAAGRARQAARGGAARAAALFAVRCASQKGDAV